MIPPVASGILPALPAAPRDDEPVSPATVPCRIIPAAEPREHATESPHPRPGRPSPASRPPAQSRSGQGVRARRRQKLPRLGPFRRRDSRRDEATRHTRQLPILAPPVEDQIRVHVMLAHHHRNRNPGLIAFHNNITLPGLAPPMAANQAVYSGPARSAASDIRVVSTHPSRPRTSAHSHPTRTIATGGLPRRITFFTTLIPNYPQCLRASTRTSACVPPSYVAQDPAFHLDRFVPEGFRPGCDSLRA